LSYKTKRPKHGNPFLLWTDLALKTTEMMIASAQVIGHRTHRMRNAGAMPSLRDQREFALMGQEKVTAAIESAQAMMHAMSVNPALTVRAMKDMWTSAAAVTSLAASCSAAEAMSRQATLFRAMVNCATSAAKLSPAVARLAHHGLKPIHLCATRNAKRLGKRWLD